MEKIAILKNANPFQLAGSIKHTISCAALILIGLNMQAQDDLFSLGPWSLRSVSGELGIEGLYQKQSNVFGEDIYEQTSKYFIGGLKLNTNSYFLTPDFISLNVNGEYNPETRDEKYLVIPDRSEVRTLKKLDVLTTMLADKKVTLSSWFNYDQSYYNRENLTNIKSDNKKWGGLLSLNNKLLPFSIRYQGHDWQQTETESGRTFNMNQHNMQARFTKSFFGSDKHDLSYNYDDYKYIYSDRNTVQNEVNRLTLNNSFYFEEARKYAFRSHIAFYDQEGRNSFTKLDAAEQLILKLPFNLNSRTSYYYYRLEDYNQLLGTNRINTSLKHQLYQSLTSEIFGELMGVNHTIYDEKEFKAGANIRYTKKIPFGVLNLGYRYLRHHNTVESESGSINIVNEAHTLSDIEGIFLDKPYVEQASVIITDVNGAVFYEEGLDYLLNEINDHIEIYRIPGGQILQDQNVLISYTAIQPGTYHYEANKHHVNASISLFKRLLELYYRGGTQNFTNVEASEFLTLNEYNQQVFGGKIYYKYISGGMEFDHYQSNLIPYKRINYYINLNYKLNSKFLFSANGTLRDYQLLNTDVNHKYTNVSGRIAYQITKNIKANFQVAYLSQRGKNIDLDLTTARIELVSSYRKIFFKTGITLYDRSYTNSTFTYTRSYAQLIRKF